MSRRSGSGGAVLKDRLDLRWEGVAISRDNQHLMDRMTAWMDGGEVRGIHPEQLGNGLQPHDRIHPKRGCGLSKQSILQIHERDTLEDRQLSETKYSSGTFPGRHNKDGHRLEHHHIWNAMP